MSIKPFDLLVFLKESNLIESIPDVKPLEIEAARVLLEKDVIMIQDVQEYVFTTAGGKALLRDKMGMDVYVGNHEPPPGGPIIRPTLTNILVEMDNGTNFYQSHVDYETLHPFMDGNGRSGRLLWLWHMQKNGCGVVSSSFLHTWYYQSLSKSRCSF